MLLGVKQDAFSAELHAAYEREAALAKELGKVKAENAELTSKLQKMSQSLKTAKVTAREALVEMADQNAKLVQAFVDKKRECKQLKAAAREDRRTWQRRLQTMETELQSNKQHIQQLLQQLNAITSKQASTPQADHHPCTGATHPQHHSPALVMRSRLAASALGYSTSSSASHNSMGMQADTSSRDDQDEVTSGVMQHASEPCPLGDATNRFSSSSNRWQQHSSPALHPCGPGGGLKSPFPSRSPAAGAENSPPRPDHQNYEQATRTAAAAATTVTAAAAHQADEQDPRQQVLQQQDSRQLLDVQRQMEELQQRAMQLEAENAELKSAQAVATAEIDSLKLLQQAEQLKQQGNHCFQAQDYQQAAAAYSGALALGVQDASLTAVLLCNRAAAQHAAGQFLDAIADCCLAHQLDPKYPRALQRRAEAYMAVQHYSAAAADLQKLVEQSGSSSEVAARLASAQVKQKLHGSVGPNHYLILGLEAGASSAEVKAAFKRLALKHHPDKATGPEAKAAAEAVFVLITAANSILSDPSKRAAYDMAYARSSLLCGNGTSSFTRSGSNSSGSSHRHSSSTGMPTGVHAWQHTTSSSFTAAQQAAATAARAATAAAAAAATAARQQAQWQQAAFRAGSRAAPADSSNSTSSGSSSTSGTAFARQTSSTQHFV